LSSCPAATERCFSFAEAVRVEIAGAPEEVKLLQELGRRAGKQLPANGLTFDLPAHLAVVT
jgi:hypothetical protein